MYEDEKTPETPRKIENLWERVTKTVEEGIKVGKEELVRTARIGKIRLDIASLKGNKNEKIRLMGTMVYDLLKLDEIKLPQVELLFEELKETERQIALQEEKIQAILAEKKAAAKQSVLETNPAEQVEEAIPPKRKVAPNSAQTKGKTKRVKTAAPTNEVPADVTKIESGEAANNIETDIED